MRITYKTLFLLAASIIAHHTILPMHTGNNSQEEDKPSLARPLAILNAIAERIIDPLYNFFPHPYSLYDYQKHLRGIYQKPAQAQYKINQKCTVDTGDTGVFYSLVPCDSNAPAADIKNSLWVDSNNQVFRSDIPQPLQVHRQVDRHPDSDGSINCPPVINNVFFYHGILIEESPRVDDQNSEHTNPHRFTMRGNQYYEYPSGKLLCIQDRNDITDNATPGDGACFGGYEEPVVNAHGEILYVIYEAERYSRKNNQNQYQCKYPVVNNTGKEQFQFTTTSHFQRQFTPNDNLPPLSYYRDCVGTVKLYPHRARLFTVISATTCTATAAACLKLLAHIATHGLRNTCRDISRFYKKICTRIKALPKDTNKQKQDNISLESTEKQDPTNTQNKHTVSTSHCPPISSPQSPILPPSTLPSTAA